MPPDLCGLGSEQVGPMLRSRHALPLVGPCQHPFRSRNPHPSSPDHHRVENRETCQDRPRSHLPLWRLRGHRRCRTNRLPPAGTPCADLSPTRRQCQRFAGPAKLLLVHDLRSLVVRHRMLGSSHVLLRSGHEAAYSADTTTFIEPVVNVAVAAVGIWTDSLSRECCTRRQWRSPSGRQLHLGARRQVATKPASASDLRSRRWRAG